jgi:hypothetical protein
MFLVYAVIGGAWAFLCIRHKDDLLPIQVRSIHHIHDTLTKE